MKLWDIAHSRTGDKGNISNISLIAYDPKDFELLKEKVTAEKVKEHFKGMVKGEVVRYELPNIHALNFVMYAALGGPVRGHARQGPELLPAGHGDLISVPKYTFPTLPNTLHRSSVGRRAALRLRAVFLPTLRKHRARRSMK